PVAETLVTATLVQIAGVVAREAFQFRGDEVFGNALQFGLGQGGGAILEVLPFGFDLLAEDLGRQCFDQDLDPGLELVVPAAIAVVHTQDGCQVGQQVRPGQEGANLRADHGCAAQAATDQHLEAQLPGFIAHGVQADVVHADSGAIFFGAVDGNLELARQEGEFRVERRPLPDDFAPGARIDQLIRSHTGELVGGGVADTVAAGLDGVHLDRCQLLQDIRHVFQVGPVQLDILARGDVRVTLVIVTGNVGQLAQALSGQHAVGNGNTQHRGVALDIQTVLQAKRQELRFGKFAGEVAAYLIAELLGAVLDDALIVLVVNIH